VLNEEAWSADNDGSKGTWKNVGGTGKFKNATGTAQWEVIPPTRQDGGGALGRRLQLVEDLFRQGC
jgi:hypothetical protein